MRPPPSMLPSQTWTSSAPAQPSAVLSTNQPVTVKPPVGTVELAEGRSMKPVYVLSPFAFGPCAQSIDWADPGAARTAIASAATRADTTSLYMREKSTRPVLGAKIYTPIGPLTLVQCRRIACERASSLCQYQCHQGVPQAAQGGRPPHRGFRARR